MTLEAKFTLRQSKVDVELSDVNRAWDAILPVKRFTLQGEIQQEKANLKYTAGGRGEAGIEVQLRTPRLAEVKVYDRDLVRHT